MYDHWGKRFAQWTLLCAGLLLLVWSGGRATPVHASPRALVPEGVATIFGIDEGGVVGSSDAAVALAAATGVNWVRGEVSWRMLEPTPGAYNFNGAAQSINRYIAAGLSPVMYIADNPEWAANTPCGPVNTKEPDKVEAFANAMGALAAQFPEVKVWALYNEMDRSANIAEGAGCFGSHTKGGVNKNKVKDSKEYAILLAAAWKAIKAANPDAQVAMGALAYDNFDAKSAPPEYPGGGVGGSFNYNFLTEVFAYMKKNPLPPGEKYLDMVLFNYYDIYGRYWERVAAGRGIQAKTQALRNKMKASGVPVVPLFIAETGNNSLTLGLVGQARCLEINLVRGAAAKLKGIIWWTFQDRPDSAPFPWNTWKYGIVDQNMQPKRSYTTLQSLATELNAHKFKKNFSGTPGFENVEAYRFVMNGKSKFVMWSSAYKFTGAGPECAWARQEQRATFNAKQLRVVNTAGKAAIIKDNGKRDLDKTIGKIAIPATNEPKIVQINP